MSTSSNRFVVFSLISLLLFNSFAIAQEYLTNESEDYSDGAPHRVKIPAFNLTFYPVKEMTPSQGALVQELADDVLHDFLPTKLSKGVTLDYINLLMTNRDDGRRLQEMDSDATAVLEFSGIASFRGGLPTVDEVNAWIREALEGILLEILQVETELNTVKTVQFTSITPSPTPAPSVAYRTVDGASSYPQASSNATFVFVAIIVGSSACVCIIALGLFWMSARRRRRDARVEPVDTDDLSKKPSPTLEDPGAPDDSDDEDSLETGQNLPKLVEHEAEVEADSVSASLWTMSTNATDAFTVKSGQAFPRPSHALMQTESFERDRQVSLKKDMLETTWSAAIPHETVKKRKDTLLTPSHFSVERCPSTDSYEVDSEWNPDDNDLTASVADEQESPFMLAAQDGDVVLVPPSRVRSTRRGF